jgi:hypothetical protein
MKIRQKNNHCRIGFNKRTQQAIIIMDRIPNPPSSLAFLHYDWDRHDRVCWFCLRKVKRQEITWLMHPGSSFYFMEIYGGSTLWLKYVQKFAHKPVLDQPVFCEQCYLKMDADDGDCHEQWCYMETKAQITRNIRLNRQEFLPNVTEARKPPADDNYVAAGVRANSAGVLPSNPLHPDLDKSAEPFDWIFLPLQ